MSDIKRFFKHSSIYAIGNILNRIGAFLLLPIYTTYLTVVEYGTLEMFYLVSSVVSGILAIGIAHATLHYAFLHIPTWARQPTYITAFMRGDCE